MDPPSVDRGPTALASPRSLLEYKISSSLPFNKIYHIPNDLCAPLKIEGYEAR